MSARLALVSLLLLACGDKKSDAPGAARPAAPDAAPADPCATAKAKVAESARSRADGRLGRARREAEQALASCPSPEARLAVAEALDELWLVDEAAAAYEAWGAAGGSGAADRVAALRARAAAPAPEALLATASEHQAAGREVEARAFGARALAHAEKRAGAAARPRFRNSASTIRAVAITADGKQVVSLGSDGALVRRDATSGAPASAAQLGEIGEAVAVDRGGTVVAVLTEGGLEVRDAASGAVRAPVPDAPAVVLRMALSPDGRLLAAASATGGTVLVDAATGKVLLTLDGGDAFLAMAFSPDGKRLAGSTSEDRVVTIFDTATGRPEKHLSGHTETLRALAWSADGAAVASGGYDGTVRVWALGTGEVKLLPAKDDVFALAFHPAGGDLAVAGRGGLWLVDSQTGVSREVAGLTDSAVSVAFAPDGATLAAGTNDGTVVIVESAGGRPLRAWSDVIASPSQLAFGRGGALLVASQDGALRVWDPATPGAPRDLGGGPVESLAVSPDGSAVATSAERGVVVLRDPASGAERRRLTPEPAGRVAALGYAPDGRRLAGQVGEALVVWDLGAGGAARRFEERITGAPAWSADGKRIACPASAAVVVWNAEAGDVALRLEVPDRAVTVAFAPDGTIGAGTGEGAVILWDPAGKELRRMTMPSESLPGVRELAFSPDGKRLAVAGRTQREVVLFDPATGATLHTIVAADEWVRHLAWRPDGRLLALAGGDKSLELYTADGALVASLAATLAGDWLVAAADGRLDGARAPAWLEWDAGAMRLPGWVGWEREATPGLLPALVR